MYTRTHAYCGIDALLLLCDMYTELHVHKEQCVHVTRKKSLRIHERLRGWRRKGGKQGKGIREFGGISRYERRNV